MKNRTLSKHDQSYRLIFSHREVVEELLQGFVHEEWVHKIDLDTLERHNGSYVSDDLQDREDDIIWRVRVQGQWIYIYLLIEFQSRVDPWMALRILVYTGLLYQDLIKTKVVTNEDLLPPIFPIVVYNGEHPWTANRELTDLIEPYAKGLQAYCPSQRYFLLDEGRIPEAELKQADSTLAEIIRLESSPEPQALRAIIGRLIKRLKDPEYDSLRRALVVWINRVVLNRLVPEETIPELTELQEIDNMLAERVEQWTEKWKQQGMQQGVQQGMQQGVQQGMQQGESKILIRQIQKRFGSLPTWAKEKIEQATEAQIEHWAENILDAPTLEDVFR
jgi:predicted transposase YdaD